MFSILSISSDIHYQPKEFLKCLKICTMVKESEVQIVTLSFVLLPLIYRLGVLQSVLGTFWLPLKEAGRNGLANQTDLPCLRDYLFPSTPVPGFADLCKTQTSGNQCFPMCYFFLFPESLLMTNPLCCLNRLSSLRWTRSVPKLTLQSVFPGRNSLLCTFPLSSYVRSCKKKLLKVSKVNESWIRCDFWMRQSQPICKSAETHNRMCKAPTGGYE